MRDVLHMMAHAHNLSPLVNFDRSINPMHENPAREEADGACMDV